jgi:pantoate--beta-alanine ligase
LIEQARGRCGYVAVSVFVNPTQFGPNEDFTRYPRTLDADLAACREAGADLVFVPSKEEIYRPGSSTFVEVAGLSDRLEGAFRPGHFRGVATVVLKLFEIVRPDVAFFGAKDYQQQLVLRRMVGDLDVPVEIVTCSTVREPDGLAMSSRNRYLDPAQRGQARSISAALFAARDRLRAGELDLDAVTSEMTRIIEAAGLSIDYATAADPETLEELRTPQAKMVLLVAARLGNVRLIDNMEVSGTGAVRL